MKTAEQHNAELTGKIEIPPKVVLVPVYDKPINLKDMKKEIAELRHRIEELEEKVRLL